DLARETAARRGDVRGARPHGAARDGRLRVRPAVLLPRSRAVVRRGAASGQTARVAPWAGGPRAGRGAGAARGVAELHRRSGPSLRAAGLAFACSTAPCERLQQRAAVTPAIVLGAETAGLGVVR